MNETSRTRQLAATRSALLDAGQRVFASEGYHGASLTRIAAAAGFTKGAVYASFATKAELLLAIYERRAAERAEAIGAAASRVRTLEGLRRLLLRDWEAGLEHEPDWVLLRLEFWAYAARDPALRARLRAAHLVIRDAIAAALERVAERSGERLPMDAGEFATCVMALGNGLSLEAVLEEPDSDRLYDEATRRLGAIPAQEER